MIPSIFGLGGVYATRQIIDRCRIKHGQRILVIGCGTGPTACLLAKEYEAQVTAVGISPRILALAKKRVNKEHVADNVALVESDAQELSFQSNTFDAVIAESVLVFCDHGKVASEAYRILKPGAVLGVNESTYLHAPPNRLTTLLSNLAAGTNVRPLLEDQWRLVLAEAGFVDILSDVQRINAWKQFKSHLQVDGVRKYFSATVHSLTDPAIRAILFDKDMLELWLDFLRHVGYGLYVGKRAPLDDHRRMPCRTGHSPAVFAHRRGRN